MKSCTTALPSLSITTVASKMRLSGKFSGSRKLGGKTGGNTNPDLAALALIDLASFFCFFLAADVSGLDGGVSGGGGGGGENGRMVDRGAENEA